MYIYIYIYMYIHRAGETTRPRGGSMKRQSHPYTKTFVSMAGRAKGTASQSQVALKY